jgi:hypothetical protein
MGVPEQAKCTTCYGEGDIVNELGSQRCPDCRGTGKQLGRAERSEHRLRDIEVALLGGTPPSEADVRWLIFEVREAKKALLGILSITQDADEQDRVALDVKYMANEALGVYAPTS